MNLQTNQTNELLYVGFNQDYGCFACGTDTGFRIFNCDPFKQTFQRDFSSKAGIGYVEMLFRCNILALVGGGREPRYPKNKVMIWDDHQNRCIGELSFRSDVKAVKLRRDRVVVVLEHKIYVYNFADLKLMDHIETTSNPRGLCALCPYSGNSVLVCPGLSRGHVRVELYDAKKTTLIAAHETALACFALNTDGSRLATASEKGTLVRVFDTSTGRPLQELRRGSDSAIIYSIAFNPTTRWLAVSSDKGTVHIFTLTGDGTDAAAVAAAAHAGSGSSSGSAASAAAAGGGGGDGDSSASSARNADDGKSAAAAGENTKSSLSFMRGYLPKYFSSEWSFAQFRVPEVRSIVAFGSEPNSIIVVSAQGAYYRAFFDPEKGGQCRQDGYAKFLPGPTDA